MASTINAKSTGVGGIDASGDASGVLALQTGGTTAVTIDASQNVGIGTTSPGTLGKLEVQATSGNFSSLAIKNNATGSVLYGGSYTSISMASQSATFQITQVGGSGYLYGGAASVNFVQGSNAPMTFATNNTERMRIDSSGNVGIGTSSPAAKLQVQGQGMFQGSTLPTQLGINYGALNINNNSADGTVDFTQGIVFTDNSINSTAWTHAGITTTGSTGFNGNLIFGTDGNSTSTSSITERMRIDSSGNVGIGTSSPAYKLDVVGNLNVSGTAGCSYFAADSTVTDTTLRTYTANTVYTLPANVTIIGSGADTFLVSIFIQYDNVGYHNWTGSAIISLTYWNAYGNSSAWSTQMSTHVNGNPVVTFYDTTGTGSRPIAFSINNTLTVTTGGFVRVTFKRIASF